MQNLTINDELKNLLPPLSAEEFAGLEESILKDGCLSPLVEWNEILVDGHHRYEICTKHQIPYAVKSVVLDSLDDAKLWIWKHQENRRNLTAYHRAEIALKLKDVVAAKAKERQKGGQGGVLLPANLPEAKETRKELAEIAGVGSRTLAKAEFIAEHADEETKDKLRQGVKGTSIDKEYNRLRAEEKASAATESIPEPDDTASLSTDEHYPPLSQPIPEKDSQFVQTVKLQNIPLNNPERLIACLFDLFERPYREKLVLDLLVQMEIDDGKKTVQRVMSKLNKKFTV